MAMCLLAVPAQLKILECHRRSGVVVGTAISAELQHPQKAELSGDPVSEHQHRVLVAASVGDGNYCLHKVCEEQKQP